MIIPPNRYERITSDDGLPEQRFSAFLEELALASSVVVATAHDHDDLYYRKSVVDSQDAANVVLDQGYTDSVLAAHLAAADPHSQYALETSALATFTYAGYGGIRLATATASSIGAGWTTVPFDTAVLATPRNVVQDFAVDALRFDTEGVVNISVAFTIAHNSINSSGRQFDIRLLNVDSGVPGMSFTVSTARRLVSTYFSVTLLTDITVGEINDRFVIQTGNTPDTYSSVVVESAICSANYISEFRGSL